MNKHLTRKTREKIKECGMTHIEFWDELAALSLINAFEDIEKEKSQAISKL